MSTHTEGFKVSFFFGLSSCQWYSSSSYHWPDVRNNALTTKGTMTSATVRKATSLWFSKTLFWDISEFTVVVFWTLLQNCLSSKTGVEKKDNCVWLLDGPSIENILCSLICVLEEGRNNWRSCMLIHSRSQVIMFHPKFFVWNEHAFFIEPFGVDMGNQAMVIFPNQLQWQ